MNVARIPSGLYKELFELGEEVCGIDPDKLIATYAIIKKSRGREIKYYSYKAKNNKFVSGFSLLRAQTSLSLSSIEKYVPLLIQVGVLSIDAYGCVTVLGNRKLKEVYGSKLIPILVGKNLIETQYNSFSVRLHSSQRKQETMISKKKHRREVLLQSKNPRTLKDLKRGEAVRKKFGEEIEINDNVILSNYGYSNLKGGTTVNGKSKGEYWKRKMKEKGLLKTRRQFSLIRKMSHSEYKQFKKMNDELVQGRYTYIRGGLAEETASIMVPVNKITREMKEPVKAPKAVKPTEKVKPLEYLDFDFIAWCINEDVTISNYKSKKNSGDTKSTSMQ